MAASPPPLSALLKKATIDDHEEVLQTCNAALKQYKGNLEAQHIKVVALLKLDRHDDALRVLGDSSDELKRSAGLEYAYALYKVGELEKALEISNKLGENRGANHVQAQASYRLEKFQEAAKIYNDLASDTSRTAAEAEENDIRINKSATDAQLEWKRLGDLVQKKRPGREDLEAFETTYNAACGCIARGELEQGDILLRRARDLCASSEDLTDQEKASELLPISVQQLFVLSSLGKTEQAKALAEELAINEIPDLSTRQIAQINKLAISSPLANPYMSHRLFHSTLSLPKTDQLFDFQKTISYQNELALDLLASKFSAVANSTERILLVRSSATTSVGVNELSTANAAAHAKNELDVKDMLPLLEKRPNDVGLTLTIVHIYLLQRNHGAAIRVLEAFFKRMEDTINESNKEARFAPGLVSILVALYSKPTTRKSHIRIELAKAASYWRHKLKRPRGLLHAAGVSLLQSSKPEDHEAAGEIFKDLLEKDPKDQLAVAGLVAAYATSDLSKVESQLNQLPQVNRLTAGVDVDALENAGVPQAASTSTILSRKRVGENSDTTTKKRNRKSRLPKEYDPKKAPGPERWLPLRDRSTYKPKGKKGKLKVAGLTQGGISEKGGDGLNASSEVIVKPASTVVGSSAKQKKKKPKK